MDDEKLQSSHDLLERALESIARTPDDALAQAALAKAFESTFEYAWKYFKRQADQAGFEVYSPRDAIKAAGQLKIIGDVDAWNRFLNARNLSVHDYVGMDDEEMRALVGEFATEVATILKN